MLIITFFSLHRCEVGIQELPKNSPLGRLRGSDNVVSFFCFLNVCVMYFYLVFFSI